MRDGIRCRGVYASYMLVVHFNIWPTSVTFVLVLTTKRSNVLSSDFMPLFI